MSRHPAAACEPPAPEKYAIFAQWLETGEQASRALELYQADLLLEPGDTWQCPTCRRHWIYTPSGWRKRYPLYFQMNSGRHWTPEFIANWPERSR